METIKGIVKQVNKNLKGVKLDNGKWYSNNFKPDITAQVGDEVEIAYKVNGNYNNHEEIKVLNKAQMQTSSAKSSDKDMTSYLVSYAKDLVVLGEKDLMTAVDKILVAYFRVKQVLASPDEFVIKYEKEILGEASNTNKGEEETYL